MMDLDKLLMNMDHNTVEQMVIAYFMKPLQKTP